MTVVAEESDFLCAQSLCTQSEQVSKIMKEWRLHAKVVCWRQYQQSNENHGRLTNLVRNMSRLITVDGATLDSKYSNLICLLLCFSWVLFFGVEIWVITPCMGRVLGGFQDQVAQRLMGRLLRHKIDGKWECTSAATAREEAGFQAM